MLYLTRMQRSEKQIVASRLSSMNSREPDRRDRIACSLNLTREDESQVRGSFARARKVATKNEKFPQKPGHLVENNRHRLGSFSRNPSPHHPTQQV